MCFDAECDLDPSLACKDPFILGHTNAESYGGKSLELGLIVSKEKKTGTGLKEHYKITQAAHQVNKVAINIYKVLSPRNEEINETTLF